MYSVTSVNIAVLILQSIIIIFVLSKSMLYVVSFYFYLHGE